MLRRIFIAINLSENIKQELAQFQKKWPALPCRWLEKQTLHITLAFLGHLNEERLSHVFEIIEKKAEQNKPFSITLNRICYGPGKKIPPRLIWAQAENSKEFFKLQKDLEKELYNLKIHSKSKPQAHITLARIKKWNWQRIEPEERPEVNLPISIEIPVHSIELMESHLKRTGAEYKVLKSVPLSK